MYDSPKPEGTALKCFQDSELFLEGSVFLFRRSVTASLFLPFYFCVLSEFFASSIGFARASLLLDQVLDTRDKERDAVGQPLYPGLDLVGCLLQTR